MLATGVAVWALVVVPDVPPLPRARQTVVDLARRLLHPGFLRPTAGLAASTACLAVGVGFLPVNGAGLHPVVLGAVVSLLAAAAALVQPLAGRRHDQKRLDANAGMAAGLLVAAAGFTVAALVPGLAGLMVACRRHRRRYRAGDAAGFAALAAAPRRNASARPWAAPRWAVSSATRAGRCWSAR